MREASSIDLIRALCLAGAEVRAHDPVAHDVARHVFADLIRNGKLVIEADPLTAAAGADAIALVTEWAEYKTLDFDAVKASVREAVIFDGRNHLDHNLLKKLGFQYVGVGRS